MSDPAHESLITITQAVSEYAVSRRTIFRMLADGRLMRYRREVGGETRIDRRELEQRLRWRPEDPG